MSLIVHKAKPRDVVVHSGPFRDDPSSLRRKSTMLYKYVVLNSNSDGTFELIPVTTTFSQRMKNDRQTMDIPISSSIHSGNRRICLDNIVPISDAPIEPTVELEAIDDGLQGDGEGLGGVDEGINGNDDEAIEKNKDDIDDEKAIEDVINDQIIDDKSSIETTEASLNAYKRKRDALT